MIRNFTKKLFSTSVNSFGVIGAGQMGTGIAIVAATVAKIPVVIYDSNDVALKKSE
jgi:3-hydroxybutyryl-CoA dehydrogenase